MSFIKSLSFVTNNKKKLSKNLWGLTAEPESCFGHSDRFSQKSQTSFMNGPLISRPGVARAVSTKCFVIFNSLSNGSFCKVVKLAWEVGPTHKISKNL